MVYFKFIGEESEINLQTKKPEFIEWKWILPEKLPYVIVDFKKDLYTNLLKIIKNLSANIFKCLYFIR